MPIQTIILAAGKGTRMKSSLPKVLHCVASTPMLGHVLKAAKRVSDDISVVYGYGGDKIRDYVKQEKLTLIEQKEQLGTGHAVQVTSHHIEDDATVLILYGDVPLIKPKTLKALTQNVTESSLGLLTVKLVDPTGYGRICREAGQVQKIVEHKDATAIEREIQEVNTGIMAVKGQQLKKWLSRLNNNNAQGEYYLTDIIEMAVNDGVTILTTHPEDETEVEGANSLQQLEELERKYQKQKAIDLMNQGVRIADSARIDIRGDVKITGENVFIDVNCVLEGNIELASNVIIEANCCLKNVRLAEGVHIKAMSHLEDCVVGAESTVGPFARLRPGAQLFEQTHIGNFVEVKKSSIGKGSKVNHLSYIGDAKIGEDVNVGAGTITCNYDGANKHLTEIEDGAFIGSGTQLVAPIKVGKNATLAAGTTLSKDAPEDALTITRAKQTTFKGWKRPRKD